MHLRGRESEVSSGRRQVLQNSEVHAYAEKFPVGYFLGNHQSQIPGIVNVEFRELRPDA
jgi:hypothetical protein